jgi:hypothetical protein
VWLCLFYPTEKFHSKDSLFLCISNDLISPTLKKFPKNFEQNLLFFEEHKATRKTCPTLVQSKNSIKYLKLSEKRTLVFSSGWDILEYRNKIFRKRKNLMELLRISWIQKRRGRKGGQRGNGNVQEWSSFTCVSVSLAHFYMFSHLWHS